MHITRDNIKNRKTSAAHDVAAQDVQSLKTASHQPVKLWAIPPKVETSSILQVIKRSILQFNIELDATFRAPTGLRILTKVKAAATEAHSGVADLMGDAKIHFFPVGLSRREHWIPYCQLSNPF